MSKNQNDIFQCIASQEKYVVGKIRAIFEKVEAQNSHDYDFDELMKLYSEKLPQKDVESLKEYLGLLDMFKDMTLELKALFDGKISTSKYCFNKDNAPF